MEATAAMPSVNANAAWCSMLHYTHRASERLVSVLLQSQVEKQFSTGAAHLTQLAALHSSGRERDAAYRGQSR